MFFCVTSGFLAVERSGRRQHVFVVTVWLAEMVLSIATLCKNNLRLGRKYAMINNGS